MYANNTNNDTNIKEVDDIINNQLYLISKWYCDDIFHDYDKNDESTWPTN